VELLNPRGVEILAVAIVEDDEARKPSIAPTEDISLDDMPGGECELTARIQNLWSIKAVSNWLHWVVIHS
jgi:hypothetical protein